MLMVGWFLGWWLFDLFVFGLSFDADVIQKERGI